MRKSNSVLSGALTLGAGAFFAKILGALYRIPLTNLLGGEGLGLYQMVFPVYCVLLDFSGAGVPSAISGIISARSGDKEKNAFEVLCASIRLLSVLGLAFSLLMLVSAGPLARLQGNYDARTGYVFLSPAVFFVAVLSCFRGYFQGLMDMKPTAFSQITEQAVKLIFGLLLSYIFLPNVPLAVGGATLAVTISEAAALTQLVFIYKLRKRRWGLNFVFDKSVLKPRLKEIVKYTVPVTLIGIAIPLSQVIDSFLVVNILSVYRSDATTLYGLLSGTATTIINLPVAVCYGVATVAIPAVSGAVSQSEKKKNSVKTMVITLAFSVPCAIIIAVFSPTIVSVLFGRLSETEKSVTSNLLQIMSVAVVLLSFLQTGNAVLIGMGKPYAPLISMGVGIAVKTLLNVILLKVPELNIYGGGLAVIACYFTACLLNLIITFKGKSKNASEASCRREYAN